MENIYREPQGRRLYVGDDKDYEKVKDKKDWATLRCCKYGDGGHQDILGYSTLGAPEGKNQYFVKASPHLAALNLLDLEHRDAEKYIPTEAIIEGLYFVKSSLERYNVLIACNSGHSRGPTVGMLYLRAIGDLPHSFLQSQRVYKTLYEKYQPGLAFHLFAKDNWTKFNGILNEST